MLTRLALYFRWWSYHRAEGDEVNIASRVRYHHPTAVTRFNPSWDILGNALGENGTSFGTSSFPMSTPKFRERTGGFVCRRTCWTWRYQESYIAFKLHSVQSIRPILYVANVTSTRLNFAPSFNWQSWQYLFYWISFRIVFEAKFTLNTQCESSQLLATVYLKWNAYVKIYCVWLL